MGKVILPLSEGELSEKTIFDRRFVIECCETFHLHWRNLRLELSADNWIQLVEAFETGIAKWRAHGSPRSHPHLELAKFLMDTSEVIHPTTANAELCENLYKTLRETHGADAEFWVEEAFVHFHYRDLRVEMPIADFLAFSKTMTAAHTKLRSHTYRPLEDLFRQLDEENIIYVVLRNWEALPESVAVGPHSDLDLLVHPLHVEKVDKLWRGERTHAEDFRVQRKVPVLGPSGEQSYILVDVRSTDDGYMPEDWCHRLLSRRVPHKMFYVLPPRDYFVSLLYHAVAHKGVMSPDYAHRLVGLAAEAGIDTDLARIGDFREAVPDLRRGGRRDLEAARRLGAAEAAVPRPAGERRLEPHPRRRRRPPIREPGRVRREGRPPDRPQADLVRARRARARAALARRLRPLPEADLGPPRRPVERVRDGAGRRLPAVRPGAVRGRDVARGRARVPARVRRDPRRARGPRHHAPRHPARQHPGSRRPARADRLRLGRLAGASLRDAGRPRRRRPRAGGLLRRIRDGGRPHAGVRALSRAAPRARRHDAARRRRAGHRSRRASDARRRRVAGAGRGGRGGVPDRRAGDRVGGARARTGRARAGARDRTRRCRAARGRRHCPPRPR